jgi:GNAT superfamily N-acetyltransferase
MSEPVLRPIHPDQHEEAIRLWVAVWGEDAREYFRRYFYADPWYQPGACFGAWMDGRLVSCVHLCTRAVEWRGGTLLCGGVANVATLPEYRRRGLSRALLLRVVDRMREAGCDFSLLFTGTHGHYAPLGWKQVRVPTPTIVLAPDLNAPALEAHPAVPDPDVVRLYAQAPRPPLLLHRGAPPGPSGTGMHYFRDWVGWRWRKSRAEMLLLPERGYVVLAPPPTAEAATASPTWRNEEPRPTLEVLEWRAVDAAAELLLLGAAGSWALRRGVARLRLPSLPHLAAPTELEALGSVDHSLTTDYAMLRNVRMAETEYARVLHTIAAGKAAWWPGDGF